MLDTEGLLAEGWVGSDGLVGFSSGAELDVGEAIQTTMKEPLSALRLVELTRTNQWVICYQPASAGALEVGNATERGENGLDGVVYKRVTKSKYVKLAQLAHETRQGAQTHPRPPFGDDRRRCGWDPLA